MKKQVCNCRGGACPCPPSNPQVVTLFWATGFAEEIFQIVTAFFESPLGHLLLYVKKRYR